MLQSFRVFYKIRASYIARKSQSDLDWLFYFSNYSYKQIFFEHTYKKKNSHTMINLTYGATTSVWLSLKEMLPAGMTAPSYQFEFVREITGDKTTFTQSDTTSNKWSRFVIGAGPQVQPPYIYKLEPGNYSYTVKELTSNTTLEIGRMVVEDGPVTWNVRPNQTPKQNVRVYKKN